MFIAEVKVKFFHLPLPKAIARLALLLVGTQRRGMGHSLATILYLAAFFIDYMSRYARRAWFGIAHECFRQKSVGNL